MQIHNQKIIHQSLQLFYYRILSQWQIINILQIVSIIILINKQPNSIDQSITSLKFSMSRTQKVAKMVKQARDYDSDDYNSDEDNFEDEEFTDDQYEIIDNLIDLVGITQNQAISFLKQTNFNFDQAVKQVQKIREKEKIKELKHKQKEQKKKDKQEQKKFDQQLERLTLQSKKKSSTMSKTLRKQSQGSASRISLNPRKSSHIIQDYDTTHYNEQYPIIQVQQGVQPSKTLNIVVVGHVDSGKSTLVGMFLHEINFVSKKQAHKNEKQSKEIGKQSFKYAWVTDSTEQERTRGVTIDVGVKKITFEDREIVFLDSPGHRDFIPNMITGAAQADYAILVVDVTHFDSTFISGGQTKQHAYIVKSLGVHKIIVAMNKMDLIQWDTQKFSIIKKKLNYYLNHIGFTEEQIIYVPVSAVNGVNITKKINRKFQCEGRVYAKSIADTLKELPLPPRPINKPFRMSITNFYESDVGKLKGHCISGKIESGVLKKDDKLLILPQNTQCIVKDILNNNEKVKRALVGDNVDILIKLLDQTYFQTIKYGNVLSSLQYSIPVARKFLMQALALDLQVPILKGTEVIAYIGTNKVQAIISKINYIYNPADGLIIKKNPKMLKSNDCAQIEITTRQRVCVEIFANFKVFGRVIIREKKQTVCVGTVKKILL